MRQVGEWKRLKPDTARSCQGSQKYPITAEEHIPNALDPGDLKLHASLEHTDVTGMDSHRFSLSKIIRHHFAIEFNPGLASAGHLLQQKTVSSEYSRPKRLLESDTQVNSRSRTQKAMTMDHVGLVGTNFDR